MLKFIRGRGPGLSSERLRLQKELFAFNKTIPHGFPYKPQAIAYDHQLGLVAIATKTGSIRVYGKPGVEFHAQFDTEIEIRQIAFIESRGQIVCLCNDSSLHLWEINRKDNGNGKTSGVLELVNTCDYFSKEQREGTLKQITVFTLHSNNETILIGTQGGNIYMVDLLDTFDLSDAIIYQDVVLQNVPDDHKKNNPGGVEVITEQPHQPDKFLIGYDRGLMVLWDNKNLSAEHFYVSKPQLESAFWLSSGEQFISSHNDGSYINWRVTDNLKPSDENKTPYGPFPCKPITKIIWKTVKNGDDFIFINGGMPRASFADKHVISIIQGSEETGKNHVLDFTSKVIDFFVIDEKDSEGFDNPKALVALVEEEIVVIDLTHPEWLQFRLPYLSSVHSSPITCCQHYADVPEDLFKKIVEVGNKANEGKYTSKEWPIKGGSINEEPPRTGQDILITGHEDGSVRFWDSSDVNLVHLYTLSTAKLFVSIDDDIQLIDGDDIPINSEEPADEWPPFVKVGTFDPFTDDPKLGIRRVLLCPFTGTLVVAGTAGQVITCSLTEEAAEKSLKVTTLNIVGDKDNFVWKGHEPLHLKPGNLKLEPGFQPVSLLQIIPPSNVTALSLHSEWSLIAAGTAYGFGLFDYIQHSIVLTRSTLQATDLAASGGGDALITRRKSFKKSLRESFRRLRKGRSQRGRKEKSSSPPSTPSKEGSSKASSPTKELGGGDSKKPVERQIEARSGDDGMGSIVKCLYLAAGNLTAGASQTPTLWAGTNAGAVYVFAVTVPSEDKRSTEKVTCQLGKEIQLKHRAPVVFIQMIDNTGYPLPEPFEVKKGNAKPPSTVGNHRVLICSEEQFKLFTLPTLKPYCKFKLTAHEGATTRKVGLAKFTSKSDSNHTEYNMMCLTNLGDVGVYSILDLKRQLQTNCTKKEDINGMSSLVFTKNGEGFYLQSPCEFRRISLSASRIINAVGVVDISEGARPKKQSENPPPIAAASIANDESENKDETKDDKDDEEVEKKTEDQLNTETIEEASTEISQQESPTSGIGEDENSGTLNTNDFSEGTGANRTDSIEETEEPELNGINGDGPDNVEVNGVNHLDVVKDTSYLTSDTSLDITVDEVTDHLMNNLKNNDVQDTKKCLTPPIPDTQPAIINLQED